MLASELHIYTVLFPHRLLVLQQPAHPTNIQAKHSTTTMKFTIGAFTALLVAVSAVRFPFRPSLFTSILTDSSLDPDSR